MKIEKISSNEVVRIHKIAHATWPTSYKGIISEEQIIYMLEWMYNLDTLSNQAENGHYFFILSEESNDLGFIAIEPNHMDNSVSKLQKIYVLPSAQGKGIGKKLLEFAIPYFRDQHNQSTFILNVNKKNKAVDFYKKMNFIIDREEDFDIGNGFLMEDYIMKLEL
jgi:GNAT superfamily N-acetyltransferase